MQIPSLDSLNDLEERHPILYWIGVAIFGTYCLLFWAAIIYRIVT